MIVVDQLDYTYKKSHKNAVKKISFNIEKGEIFGFLGPSGAGKTTTQRLLIGLLRDYKGSILILGKERSTYNKEFYEKIGVAFDFPNLYLKLTAKENLDLIGSYYKHRRYSSEELLDQVGLLPDKDKKVESYSKGMKMRLNFIRSLIHDPEVLFFDEPTSGLDPVNGRIIKDMIVRMKSEGKTIFLTTHNMTVAEQLCDRVAFIVDGETPVIDSPQNLMIEYGENKVEVVYEELGVLNTCLFKLDELKRNQSFVDMINTKNIKTIHSKEASLEEIFIKLTGKALI